jgi:hypothetical protein
MIMFFVCAFIIIACLIVALREAWKTSDKLKIRGRKNGYGLE